MILDIIQIVSAVALIVVILMQNSSSGGLGSAFGGDSNVYSTKRGVEKTLFRITVTLALVFFITAFINIFN